MELENARPETPAMTFDEVSMESSKSFVKALQELKSLRPQLYSAAEYCEKSYLHSEQKQTVLDNLKDYAVRSLVNAVDHLGTVAYKLNDLLERKTLDISTAELKISCLNQQLLTCQTYMEKEGLRQQLFLAFIPSHHKHYILPNTVNKKVHFNPYIQTDAGQSLFQATSCLQPSGSSASKTLSWHLASETNSTLKGSAHAVTSSTEDPKIPGKSSAVFRLLANKEDNTWRRSSGASGQLFIGTPTSSAVTQTIGVPGRGVLDGSKPLTAFRSFDSPRREVERATARSKSMLSSFFVKQKTPKLKAGSVS